MAHRRCWIEELESPFSEHVHTKEGILEPLVHGGQDTPRVVVVVTVRERTRYVNLVVWRAVDECFVQGRCASDQPFESMRRSRRSALEGPVMQ